MNRISLCSLMLPLALVGACGNVQTSGDMTASKNDLGTAPLDLASSDLAVAPPKLTVSGCATATVTTATVFSTIIMNNCAGGGCHRGTGATQTPMFGNTAAAFGAAVVGLASSSTMNYITANDIDNSYLLYKILNQQLKVPGGSGGQMPDNLPALSAADMCTLVNWVRSGAK